MSLTSDQAELISPPTAYTHYQIRRRLGSGGFGQVFEAWDSRLLRHVALKQLNSPISLHGPQSLLKEAQLAASLKHSAFVRIFSIDEYNEAPAIVMELVEGSTLNQRTEQVMTLPDALDIVDQVAEAMQEAHATDLVHGDIKPSNLMIEASGKIRILDFGLARHIDPLATQSQMPEDTMGTIAYMAPERLLGQSSSPRSDVYALGVVLYELLTGARPFAQLNGLALAAAHVQTASSQWDFTPGFDLAAAALIRAMTEREPARRLQTMKEVRDRIAAVSSSGTGVAAISMRKRWHAHHRAWLAWGATALLILLVGGVGWQWGTDKLGAHLLALVPTESNAVRAGMLALETPDRQGSLETAIQSFRDVLEKNPNHATAAAGLSLAYGLRYASDGRDEAWLSLADASAQQALHLDPQLALAHAAQAAVWEYQGRYPQALEAGEKALQLDPFCVLAALGQARLLIKMHRNTDAERAIHAAMQRFPRERRFADLLGTLHYQQGEYKQAEQDFRNSLQLQPDAVYAYANLSAALLHQDRGDEALHLVQQGLALRPDSTLYNNLGNILFARAQYGEAAAAFEQATRANPNDYLMWSNLADALRWIPGRTQAAQTAYRHACTLLAALLQRSPNNINRMSRMGLYLARMGDYPAALTWSERALAAASSSPDVQFRAAIAFELAGRRTDAINSLTRARALGYAANLIDSEPDLVALRRTPLYQSQLMEHSL